MSQEKWDHSKFFLIDIFTVFVSILSLKSKKSEELFQAIKAAIPNLFKLLKCYNAISKSAEFTIFWNSSKFDLNLHLQLPYG
jgi:hypothetical protein